MKRASASDLSSDPFLTVLEERSPLRSLLDSHHCVQCLSQSIKYVFQQVLQSVEMSTDPRSWQQNRLHAFLNPLYLESLQSVFEMDQQVKDDCVRRFISFQPPELLLVSESWDKTSWCTHQDAMSHNSKIIEVTIKQLLEICHNLLRSVDDFKS